jgi:cAMP-specific phosphodiesterase
MDSTRFTSDDLCGLLLELFKEAGLPDEVPISCVKCLILAVREHMYDNPYHNWAHVFDVVQTVYVLSSKTGTMQRLDAWERFALLAAALCHDLEHPGVDSTFLARAALGDAFRNKLLEKHHTLCAFEIMADSEIGVLQGISTVRYYAFRQAVSGCILATCFANHSEFVAKLSSLTGEGGVATKQLEMELLLKAADISNVIKPFPVAARWALRITDEFFLQGDVERQHDMLPVTALYDREHKSRVAIQTDFIDFVCKPFFDALAILYPVLRPAVLLIPKSYTSNPET